MRGSSLTICMGSLCTSHWWDFSDQARQPELRRQLLSSGTPELTRTSSQIGSSGGPKNHDGTRCASDPMRYVCRAEDWRAFGTARFSFTTEEEMICHWKTFHVALMPQFTCQHPGCGTVFTANPGSLDRYLSHIEWCRKE